MYTVDDALITMYKDVKGNDILVLLLISSSSWFHMSMLAVNHYYNSTLLEKTQQLEWGKVWEKN